MRTLVLAAAAIGLTMGSASAGIGDFTGTWMNGAAADQGFFDNLIGSDKTSDDIGRIVVTPAGTNAVRVHLFGRCAPECDWGSVIARNHSSSPKSDEVEAVTADFITPNAAKRLTLRKGPGRTLQFEVVTDFTDHSARHDYIAIGSLRFVVPPVATTSSVPANAPASAPVSMPAPTTTPVAAAQPAAPAALAAAEVAEDCVKINPEDVFVAPSDRGWKVEDFEHTILNFANDKVAAVKASRVMTYYRFDEQCYIARPKPKMIYWRIAGQFPRDPMPGEDCVDLNPAGLSVKDGKVLDGSRVVADFGGDDALAGQAVSVMRTYRLNKQCFVARPNDKMVYWLSR